MGSARFSPRGRLFGNFFIEIVLLVFLSFLPFFIHREENSVAPATALVLPVPPIPPAPIPVPPIPVLVGFQPPSTPPSVCVICGPRCSLAFNRNHCNPPPCITN